MNPTIDQTIISSFKEYLDHKIVSKLGAWKNVSAPLFLDPNDDRMTGYKKVNSGSRQFLYDSSVSGAVIADPSQFASSGWREAKTDFKNSRFLVTQSETATAPSSGTFAVKHFNSYVSSMDDVDLFENTNFGLGPEMLSQIAAVGADSYYAPCYFIKSSTTENKPLELGGLENTIFNLKIVCFVKSEGELISLASIIRDLRSSTLPILLDTPLDYFNDIKSRPWSYHTEVQKSITAGSPTIYVNEANFTPLKMDGSMVKMKNTYIGLGNITISTPRYPRQ